jgi:hypothetical protein
MMPKSAWEAMTKFCEDEPLTELEWKNLSRLTMIDRKLRSFELGNIRWAETEEERADNLAFYRSL